MAHRVISARAIALLACTLYGSSAVAQAGRGELLYKTYCDACHSEQVHWREHRLAPDWTGLVAEVQRWQGNAALRWDMNDVESVAIYLNQLYYHYPPP